MPIRMLRDCTDSEAIHVAGETAENLFYRLIQKADDYGRFHGDPRMIRSFCFPLRDDLRYDDISDRLANCQRAGLISLYEVGPTATRWLDLSELASGASGGLSKRFLLIHLFGQRLRDSREKFPPPPEGDPPGISAIRRKSPEVAGNARLNGIETRDGKPNTNLNAAHSSPEAASAAPATYPIFDTVGNPRKWELIASLTDSLKDAFPSLDVEATCRRAHCWLVSNPGKRKTAKGMGRFLNSWFGRENDSGRSSSNGNGNGIHKTASQQRRSALLEARLTNDGSTGE